MSPMPFFKTKICPWIPNSETFPNYIVIHAGQTSHPIAKPIQFLQFGFIGTTYGGVQNSHQRTWIFDNIRIRNTTSADMDNIPTEMSQSIEDAEQVIASTNQWADTFAKDLSGLTQFSNMLEKEEKLDVASAFFCCYKVGPLIPLMFQS